MVTTTDGGNDASREPLVGRGSARRVEANGVEANGVEASGPPPVDAGDGGDGIGAALGAPSLTRSSRGRRWLDAGAQIPRARLALGLALVVGLAAAWTMVSRRAPVRARVDRDEHDGCAHATASRERRDGSALGSRGNRRHL